MRQISVLPNLMCKTNKDFFDKEGDREIEAIPGLIFADKPG